MASQNPRHYNLHTKIRVNGQEYPTLEGGTFRRSGKSRETVTGSEVHGYKETAVSARVQFTMPTNYQTDFEDLNDQTDVTVEVETDTGQIWLMANAWSVEPPETQSGDLTVVYEAVSSERIA